MPNPRAPIQTLPPDYRRDYTLNIEDPQVLMKLQSLSFWGLLVSLAGCFALASLAALLRPLMPFTLPIPEALLWLMVIGVLFVHEWLHGLAIGYYGHRPLYGVKWANVGAVKVPLAFYATSGGGYFARDAFIVVALTPLIVITLIGALLYLLIPFSAYTALTAILVVNGSGAVGDVWMYWVVRRYPADALVYDDADSIGVYVRDTQKEDTL